MNSTNESKGFPKTLTDIDVLLEDIVELTGLSIEEINSLKDVEK